MQTYGRDPSHCRRRNSHLHLLTATIWGVYGRLLGVSIVYCSHIMVLSTLLLVCVNSGHVSYLFRACPRVACKVLTSNTHYIACQFTMLTYAA